MSMPEVVAALGEPDPGPRVWTRGETTASWLASCFQVTFDAAERAVDIQLCARGPVVAMVQGIDVLHTPAAEVVAGLSGLGEGRYEEDGFSFWFPDARLSFWRQGLPDDDWEPEDYDQYRDGRFWDTVNTWAERPAGAAVVRDPSSSP
jgi:hypothetical protein